MRVRVSVLAALLVAMLDSATANAAFIVEGHSSGKAFANFASTNGVPSASIITTSPGLQATNSIFGGSGTVDEWTFSYTPNTNLDNTVFAPLTVLGTTRMDPPGNPSGVTPEAQLATGLVGGESGIYKVYITWPTSGNVTLNNSIVTVTSDTAPIVLDPVDQNGVAGTTVGSPTPSGIGGDDKWLLIGTVHLTAGNTYTVVQTAKVNTFTSQRNGGVMWELLEADGPIIPEPSTLALGALSLLGFAFNGRRRNG